MNRTTATSAGPSQRVIDLSVTRTVVERNNDDNLMLKINPQNVLVCKNVLSSTLNWC